MICASCVALFRGLTLSTLAALHMSRVWKCGLCSGAFVCLLLSELLTHFYVQHENEEGFHIKCGIQGCQNSYRLYNSLYKHIRSKHTAFLHVQASELTGEIGIDFELVLQPVRGPPGDNATNNPNSLLADEVRVYFLISYIAEKLHAKCIMGI